MQWDPTQQEIIEKVAAKEGISVEKAKGMVEFYLRSNSRHIRKYEPVVVPNIGVFYLDPRETNERVLKVFKVWRAGLISDDEFWKAYNKYMPLHKLARTHFPGTGKKYKVKMYFKNKGKKK